MKRLLRMLSVSALWLIAWQVQAVPQMDQTLLELQEQWAHINYELPRDQRADQYGKLAQQLQQLQQQNPQAPEPLIWRGIVLSTWAGVKGGLGALGLVKDARSLFEQSLQMSQDALHGSAYTSLGSLYYQVPGWPIGFGDDKKALQLLEKAVAINPQGIDSNFFLADYWLDQGEYAKSKQYFDKALQAPSRPERPIADAGRRQEIKDKLASIERKLK